MARPGRGRASALWVLPVAAVVVFASLGAISATAAASPNPPLPVALGSRFVGNLSAPGLYAGASGTIALTLSNPLTVPMTGVVLSLNLYAFNAFPGNATSSLSGSTPPVLTPPSGASGLWANFTFPTLPSGSRDALSVSVATASATSAGDYSVRTSLLFEVPNATVYRLASRGWFTQALWEEATEEPNGSAVLDAHSLAVLNISGVLPETSIQVTSSTLDIILYVLLGAVFVLVGVGAYLYFRRSAHSKSGAR